MIIYTDGACSPNPGKGGYGVIIYDDNNNLIDCYSHYENNTTNNIQEIKAILYTFLNYGIKLKEEEFIEKIPIVYSDSAYCVNTFNNWMFSWARNGWLKSDKKEPENLELIKAYYDWYQKGYRIDLRKVKGHKGIEGNELADKLATGSKTTEEILKNYKNML
jgi:ribonuclease HI